MSGVREQPAGHGGSTCGAAVPAPAAAGTAPGPADGARPGEDPGPVPIRPVAQHPRHRAGAAALSARRRDDPRTGGTTTGATVRAVATAGRPRRHDGAPRRRSGRVPGADEPPGDAVKAGTARRGVDARAHEPTAGPFRPLPPEVRDG
ncbi:hypothetical protein [Kocuria sp. KH4]